MSKNKKFSKENLKGAVKKYQELPQEQKDALKDAGKKVFEEVKDIIKEKKTTGKITLQSWVVLIALLLGTFNMIDNRLLTEDPTAAIETVATNAAVADSVMSIKIDSISDAKQNIIDSLENRLVIYEDAIEIDKKTGNIKLGN